MQLDRQWIEGSYRTHSMRSYRVRPAAAGTRVLPTVIVIQEVWGVDEHIQDMADRFAMSGYQAFAPDLYSLGSVPEALSAPRIQAVKRFLDTVPPQAWGDPSVRDQYLERLPATQAQELRDTLGRLFAPKDNESLVGQLRAWVDYAEQLGGPVVSIGYCMGGALSFLLATEDSRIKAAVCNYGTAPAAEALTRIEAPVYGFYGGTDHRITDAVPEVSERMTQLGKTFHYKIYPQAGHAFFNDSRSSYDVDAARDAWAETLGFFNRELKA
ncbi:MAG: dienelactone hydrolase family protein [Sulfobacillus acidophilus]|uniref:Dienelactone hydrolase family protein n=1 Tax=Sulfobacillus acidophilus TaxID=53633 RepID=A0A2T2WPB9_9FIRM|nr:MAG: dienelactone hydrolase family protein [Sulfobacillus acidophilus]